MKLDLILTNAKILTMDPTRPAAQSIGVMRGRIVAIDDDLDGLVADTRVDADGAIVAPGFHDAHAHTTWFGLTLGETDLSTASSIDEIYQIIKARTEQTDGWVTATGFNHHTYGGRYPDLAELDRITGVRPLFIRQTSGHASIANTEALTRAGVFSPGFIDPDGGVTVRDDDGAPTGVLEEQSQSLVQDLIRPYSRSDIIAALDRATSVYAAEGITSFTEAGIGYGWIGHSPVEVSAYQAALDQGVLSARAQLMVSLDGLHEVAAHADDDFGIGLDLGIRSGFGDDRLSFGPLKVFMDGALSSRSAALTSPYEGMPDNSGYLQADESLLRSRILDAYRSGWSIAAHAIGDRAIDIALAVIEEGQRRYGVRRIPNRIEHAAVVRPDQLSVFARSGIVPVPQPAFFQGIGDGMKASLGSERTSWTYRGRSFLDAGIVLPGSSDRPCANGNPLRCIQAAVDRRTGGGDTFAPEEAISAAESLRAYTLGSAQATGTSRDRGSLQIGKLADFVMLSESPLDVLTEQISQIEVLATFLGGQLTHDAR